MSLRIALSVVSVAAITACGPIDTLTDGFAHTQAVSAELERSLGLKSFVGFRWSNGSLTSVDVVFEGIPQDISLPDLAEKSKKAIVAEFKQTPQKIAITFTMMPNRAE